MTITEQIHQVFGEAMALPIEARMILVESLIEASPCDTDIPGVPGQQVDKNEAGRLWIEECKRRWKEVESGQSELVDAEIVLREAKARVERHIK